MAIKNFIQPDYYVSIGSLTFDKKNRILSVRMNVYESENGLFVLPVDLQIDRYQAVQEYKENKRNELVKPEYPELCASRDKMVPMWTEESTEAEKEEYNAALSDYTSEMEAYEKAVTTIEIDAESANEYDQYFPSELLYGEGNIEQCIYTWVKTLSMFEEVIDA